MIIEAPPLKLDESVRAYLLIMWRHINNAINSANGVGILTARPERPKVGKIYYIKDDINVAGYYVFVDDEWKRLAYKIEE